MPNSNVSTKSDNIKRITFTAIMIALSSVLSMIPLYQYPLGGKVTPASMLPVLLVVLKYDTRWGVFTTFLYSVLQAAFSFAKALTWGLTPFLFVMCILFDYILAYTSLAVAGMFRRYGNAGAIAGVAFALFMRFVMHMISGMTCWGYVADKGFWGAFRWSLLVNGPLMAVEFLIILLVLIPLLATKAYQKIMEY